MMGANGGAGHADARDTTAIPEIDTLRQETVRKLAGLLAEIERDAAELRSIGGSTTFGLVFCVTVRNGRESRNFYSTSLKEALAEAAADIAALRALGRMNDPAAAATAKAET